jgi:GBP family porin
MKKIATAVALLAPFALAHAQSSVTVYGILDASVSIGNGGNGAKSKRLDSGVGPGSRLGFRGNEDLGGGLKAVFTAEMGIDSGAGTFQQGNLPFGRQLFVGLGSGNTWSLTLGRQLSPSEIAITAADALAQNYWNSTATYGIGTLMSPTGNAVVGSGCQGATVRVNNSVLGSYSAAGFTGRFMVAAGDENPNGTGRLVNPSIEYKNGPVMLTAAYTRMRQCQADFATPLTSPGWQTEKIVGGSYDFGFASLFAGYYAFDPSEANKVVTPTTLQEQKVFWVGARIPVGSAGTILAQVSRLKAERDAPDAKGTGIGLTYLHNLSKRTRVYVSSGRMQNNNYGSFSLTAATASQPSGGPGTKPNVISFGVTHLF